MVVKVIYFKYTTSLRYPSIQWIIERFTTSLKIPDKKWKRRIGSGYRDYGYSWLSSRDGWPPHQSSVACFATERIPLLLSLKCLATHVFGLLGDDSWSYVMKMFGFVLVWFLVFLSFSRSHVSTPVGLFRVIFVF